MTQRSIIKTYYQTGDIPTQAQFYEWLDDVIFSDEFSGVWFSSLQSQPLTGYVASSGNISSSDTVFSALQKISGNFLHKNQDDTFTGKLTIDGSLEGILSSSDYILNVGTDHTTIINVGKAGVTTVNFFGNAVNWNPIQSTVADQLITLNKGGGAGTAIGTGWEIEENSIITGYIKTVSTRDGFRFLTPAIAYGANLGFQNLTATRSYTLPDHNGEILANNLVDTVIWANSSGTSTALGSIYGYYTGAGNTTDLGGTATTYSRLKYTSDGSLMKMETQDASNNNLYLLLNGSQMGLTARNSSSGYFSQLLMDTAGVMRLYSSFPAFAGLDYHSAIAATVTANQTQYSILHRAANDARYAPISGAGYLALSGGTMTGTIAYSQAAGTALGNSSGNAFYVGSGNNVSLASATTYGYAFFDGGNNTATLKASNGTATSYMTVDGTILLSATNSGNTSQLYIDSTTAYIFSGYTSFTGLTYTSATATKVTTNQTQYSLLHRAAGDDRWLTLSGGTMTGNLILNGDATSALQAVTYQQLNAAVVGLYDLRGGYNASTNLYPSSGGSGTAGAVLKADIWIITVAGTLGGTAVTPGDEVIALSDTPGQTAGNWSIMSHDIGYTPITNVLNSGYTLIGNGSNVATAVSPSGDWTWTNAGVTTISSGVVTYAKIQTIGAYSLIGNPTASTATAQAVTLGAGISFTGTTIYIAAGAITNAMLGGSISDGNLASSYIYANGTRGLTAAWDAGAFLITSQAKKVSGTGGAGYMEFVAQSSNASAPGSAGFRIFAGATGSFNWARKNGTDTFVRTFDATLTADRTYTLPDYAGTFATLAGTETLSNKTLASGTIVTTQAQADNSTKIASTAYVDTGLANAKSVGGNLFLYYNFT